MKITFDTDHWVAEARTAEGRLCIAEGNSAAEAMSSCYDLVLSNEYEIV